MPRRIPHKTPDDHPDNPPDQPARTRKRRAYGVRPGLNGPPTTWEVGAAAGGRAISRLLKQWRAHAALHTGHPGAKGEDDPARTMLDIVARMRRELWPSAPSAVSISRYEDPSGEYALALSLKALAAYAHFYGHTLADLGAHFDHAMEPWLVAHDAHMPSASRPPSMETRLVGAYRLLSAEQQREMLGFLELLAGLGSSPGEHQVPPGERGTTGGMVHRTESDPALETIRVWTALNAPETGGLPTTDDDDDQQHGEQDAPDNGTDARGA